MSIRSIAETVKLSKSVVGRIVKCYNDTGRIVSPCKAGRPRKTTKRDDRAMQRMALKDRFVTSSAIKREINDNTNVNVSRQTVSRRLQEIGLFSRVPQKKPLISLKNQKKRLEYASEHVLWTDEKWDSVFFSDESKFNLFGSDGKTYVKRRVGEKYDVKCTKKTVKFGGGSVMVFGMISSEGTTPLIRLTTRVNAAIYKNILVKHVVPAIERSGVEEPIFMQDNAPCHKAKSVMSYLNGLDFEIMDWPAQSPDLNPIENIWKMLGDKVMKRNPSNVNDLWQKLQEEWATITAEYCKKLIQSCSRRCTAVIEKKGLFTKY